MPERSGDALSMMLQLSLAIQTYMGGGKGNVSEAGVESLSESSALEGNLAEEEDTVRGRWRIRDRKRRLFRPQ